ncbi:SDR family oxidoreductase [Psychroflexus salinarum]|uniref:SDR family oxidoreductase n=1 Tax=Psychroflexus salinarum TaxID=546024 RepID=A0ABW3GKI4_9FLAO
MYTEFKNKVVIITGASSGIGKATALAFSNEGAKLVLSDVQDDEGETLAEEIRKKGNECIYMHCDISKPADVQKMVKESVKKFGRLDIAYNNAGIEGKMGFTADGSEENFDRIIGINLKGVWACMKYEIPEMLKNKKGVIVNCSSIAGVIASPGLPVYVASKHGVNGLTKNAALEYAKQGIRVNSVCPAGVDTPMLDRIVLNSPGMEEQMDTIHPIGRAAKPKEIADAVLYLCSDRSSFITGHELLVDGGYTIQ